MGILGIASLFDRVKSFLTKSIRAGKSIYCAYDTLLIHAQALVKIVPAENLVSISKSIKNGKL